MGCCCCRGRWSYIAGVNRHAKIVFPLWWRYILIHLIFIFPLLLTFGTIATGPLFAAFAIGEFSQSNSGPLGGHTRINDTGKESNDAHDRIIGLFERDSTKPKRTHAPFCAKIWILDGKFQKFADALLGGTSTDMFFDFGPVIVVHLDTFEQQQDFLV